MKKTIVVLSFALFLFGCKEEIIITPNKWQTVTYSNGNQVINQKWGDIKVKFSPHYLDDAGTFFVCDFEVFNSSREIVTISNEEVLLFKDGEQIPKFTKESIKMVTSFMASYTESMDKDYGTYDPFSTASKDKYEEKKRLDNQSDMILVIESIDPGNSIRRFIVPSSQNSGNYVLVLPVGEKRFELAFTLK